MTQRIRDTRLLAHDELMSAAGSGSASKLADVATYKTRTPGKTWKYGTMIIGYTDGKAARALAFTWTSEAVAVAQHQGLCSAIFREQGVHTLQ